MIAEEWYRVIREDKARLVSLSSKEIEEIIEIFSLDADDEASNYEVFLTFAQVIQAYFPNAFFHKIHLVMTKYILVLENQNKASDELLGMMYMLEAEYYLGTGTYSTFIRYVFKTLERKNISPRLEVTAYSMLLTMFHDHNMIQESKQYCQALEEIVGKGVIPEPYQFYSQVGLLSVHSANGDIDRFNAKVEEIERVYPSDSLDDVSKAVFSCYKLGGRVKFFKNEPPTPEFIAEYKLVINNLIQSQVDDSFAYTLIPVFRYIEGKLSREELVSDILKIIEFTVFIQDKLNLFRFMINELKIDKFKYDYVYKRYYDCLEKYYLSDLDNQKSIIQSTLIEHEKYVRNTKSAYTDGMTGIGNRLAYDVKIEKMCKNKINLNEKVGIVLMDMNGLKKCNDNLGHDAGDKMLKDAAKRLSQFFGEIGSVYRIGGDEFAALVIADKLTVIDKMDTLKKMSEDEENLPDGVSMAIGCAFVEDVIDEPDAPRKFAGMIKCADKRMYENKRDYYRRTGILPRGRR